MKLIDRYILRTFLVPLFVTAIAFNLFFVVYDLFDNFDTFVEAKASVREVLLYYSYLLPPNFWIIMPIVLLLAVLFALYQLTRHNELTAMRASGISLYRLLVPYVIVGMLVAIGVGIIDETVGPTYSKAYNEMILGFKGRKPDAKAGADGGAAHLREKLMFFNESNGRDWYIVEMDTREASHHRLQGVRITQNFPGTQEYKFTLDAESATFRQGGWLFKDGLYVEYRPGLLPMKRQKFTGEEQFKPGFDEAPELFANLSASPDEQFMSSRKIMHFLRRAGDNIKPEVQRRLWSDLHSRLSRPLGCFIATLLGIPFGFQTARKGIFAGMLICFGAFFAYYGLFIVFMALSNKGLVPPFIGGWGPNILFTGIGLILFLRMRQ